MTINRWKNQWGESRSLTSNKYGMKEPINALSSLLMGIYVLYNIYYTNITINKLLKLSIAINLFSSFIAHATYNQLAILLDGMSMVFPIIILAIYYNNYGIALLLFFLMLQHTSIGFVIGLLYLLYISKNKIIKVINTNNIMCASVLIIISTIGWFIDQNTNLTKRYWFVNLHSLWHIGCAYGLLMVIDNIIWN